jgi:hypothetical protein
MACVLPAADPQTIGSGTTYLRRYHYSAMVGIAPEDDDAETAMGRTGRPVEAPPARADLALLSAAQIKEIDKQLALIGRTREQLTTWIGYAEKLEEIYAKDYDRIIKALKERREGKTEGASLT